MIVYQQPFFQIHGVHAKDSITPLMDQGMLLLVNPKANATGSLTKIQIRFNKGKIYVFYVFISPLELPTRPIEGYSPTG